MKRPLVPEMLVAVTFSIKCLARCYRKGLVIAQVGLTIPYKRPWTILRVVCNANSMAVTIDGSFPYLVSQTTRTQASNVDSEIRTLFDPDINTITSLVQMQINISKRGIVKIVYLVGGFGESASLRKSPKKVVPEGIEVISLTNAWTAVVRGAPIQGLAEASPLAAKVSVGLRAARNSYGCAVSKMFRAGVPHHHRKYAVSLPT